MTSQISSAFKLTAVGTQSIASLAALMAAVPIDLDLLRSQGLFPGSDATAISGQVATRTINCGMGQGGFAASASIPPASTTPPGGGGPVTALTLLGFSPSPWAAPPTISFTGGSGGSGAAATCQMGLNTSLVILLNGGTGYSSATTAKLVGGNLVPGGTPATLGAIGIGGGGAITSVVIATPGSGYTTYPEIVFTDSGGGSGAVVLAMLNPVGLTLVSGGKDYQSAPNVVATAVFKGQNPDTTVQGNTISGWMQGPLQAALRSPVSYTLPVVS